MTNVIELINLTKNYGSNRGIADITLSVPEATIFGFLGPNGAGKSTTINILLGLIGPSSGEAKVFGNSIKTHGLEIRRDLGFLPSDMALDGHLTGWQQMEYFGKLRADFDASFVRKLADKLDCDLARKIHTLSRGNRQKIGLIQALMHRPKLLILDEPTSGLDPLIQAAFNEILIDHKESGLTTFISSHILSEVQELCDHVAFIREGKLVTSSTIGELLRTAPKNATLISTDYRIEAILENLPGVSNFYHHNNRYSFDFNGKIESLIKLLSKFKIDDFTISNTDLEGTFMAYYKNKGNQPEK